MLGFGKAGRRNECWLFNCKASLLYPSMVSYNRLHYYTHQWFLTTDFITIPINGFLQQTSNSRQVITFVNFECTLRSIVGKLAKFGEAFCVCVCVCVCEGVRGCGCVCV
jgi:hypothetical protein